MYLSQTSELPEEVEEGLCELMSYFWLVQKRNQTTTTTATLAAAAEKRKSMVKSSALDQARRASARMSVAARAGAGAAGSMPSLGQDAAPGGDAMRKELGKELRQLQARHQAEMQRLTAKQVAPLSPTVAHS